MHFSPFESPLIAGRLVRRYKRFLADIKLADGTEIIAHCPNSGSMLGMADPGMDVMVRHVPDPKRKLKWTWELVHDGNTWIGCNTARPNEVVAHLIDQGHIPGLGGPLRREVKYGREGRSRIDILLGDHELTYVEVKNTTLALGNGRAAFPDAVTARGAKHMDELVHVIEEGHKAAVVFLVNRGDCTTFSVADHIDPTYAAAFARARAAGVQMIPFGVDVGPDGWQSRGVLPVAPAP